MAQYKARPQIDPLVRDAIETEKRAQRKGVRKERLLDARTRIYGIDTDALGKHVDERKNREAFEKQRDLYYDDVNLWQANQIKEMERARQAKDFKDKKELEAYRLAQIADRDRVRAEAQAKFDAFAEQQSDFLNFQGEDLDKNARTKAMHVQQQDWLQQQIYELSAKEAFDKKEQEDYDAQQAKLNGLMVADEADMNAEYKLRRLQLQAENKYLAEEKRSREAQAAAENAARNDAEIAAQINSAYLNERFAGELSGRAGFKGFSQDQRQAILDEQEVQRQALANKRLEEAQANSSYDAQQEEIRRMMILMDREKSRGTTTRLHQLREERKVQALEKTERYKYLDTVMFSDPIREEYFEQFGASDR